MKSFLNMKLDCFTVQKNKVVLLTGMSIALIDQITKLLVKASFSFNESVPIIKNFFHITYITNTGTAFGILKDLNTVLALFSIAVIVVIFYYVKNIKENELAMQISVGLLLGGTVGNIIDRLFYGAVIDFIDFRIWPVFNLADSAVTISVVCLLILLWNK